MFQIITLYILNAENVICQYISKLGEKRWAQNLPMKVYTKKWSCLMNFAYYRTMLSFLHFVLTGLYPHKTGNALFIYAILKGFAFLERKWGLTKHPVYQVHLIHQYSNEICNLFNLLKNLVRKDVFICILQLKKTKVQVVMTKVTKPVRNISRIWFQMVWLHSWFFWPLDQLGFNQRSKTSRRYILRDLLQVTDLPNCGSWLGVKSLAKLLYNIAAQHPFCGAKWPAWALNWH